MARSPSWETNRTTAIQIILHFFMEHENSLPSSQKPATCPYAGLINPVHVPRPTSLISPLILYPQLRLGFPSGFLLSGLPNKNLYAPLLPPIHLYNQAGACLLRGTS